MELYLIKSAVILTILYGFYKLVLENESMHIFKRFYLLGSLPAAFMIPLITFTSYVEVPVSSAPVFIGNTLPMPMPATEVSVNIWPFVLWGLYALGVVFFTIKFGKNLNQLFSKIKNNPKFTRDSINHILLKTPVVPHTFLNYVFLNKQKFEANEIPEEVIQHEHIHAKQKHSIDILLVELLQIVFWFNPVLYFIKRSIKLNHEFLADRAVLNQGTDTVTYQNLLLAFSSNAGTPTLANSINYSFIKKRFTVMKKQTSPQAAWLRSLFVLPLLAILFYGFSSKQTLLRYQETNHQNSNETIKEVLIQVDKSKEILLNGKKTELKNLAYQVDLLNAHLTREQKNKYLTPTILIENAEYKKVAEEIVVLLWDIEIYNVSIAYVESLNNLNLKKPGNKFVGRTIAEAEEIYLIDNENVKKRQSKNQLEDATPWSVEVSGTIFIEDNTNRNDQDKATKEEIEEYNKLAKKYNKMTNENRRVDSAEFGRINIIYSKMTIEQKENAEPFPSFPPPPPVPPVPATPVSTITNTDVVKPYSLVIEVYKDDSFSINNSPATMENYKAVIGSILESPKLKDRSEEVTVYIKSEELVKMSFMLKIGEELKKYNIEKMLIPSGLLDDRK